MGLLDALADVLSGRKRQASANIVPPANDVSSREPSWAAGQTHPGYALPSWLYGRPLDHGTNVTDDAALYAEHIWTYVCVWRIATLASSVPVRFWQEPRTAGGKRVEVVGEDTVAGLFSWVNPFSNTRAYWRSVYAFLELSGSAYTYFLLPDPRWKRDTIWSLMPDRVKAVPDPEYRVKGWEYSVGTNKTTLAPETVLQFTEFNPRSDFYGMGTIQAIRREIDSDLSAIEYNRNFFRFGALPGIVLENPSSLLPEDEEKRIKEQWIAKHQGVERAHAPAVLWGGMTAKVIETTRREMDYTGSRDALRKEIQSAFGLNDAIMGYDTANLAQAAEYNRAAYNSTILPKIEAVLEQLNQSGFLPERVVAMHDVSRHWAFVNEWTSKMGAAVQGVSWDILSANEAREILGFGPRVRTDEPATEQPAVQTAEEPDDLKAATIRRKARRLRVKALVSSDPETRAAFRDVRWKSYVKRTEPRERQWVARFAPIFDKQRGSVLAGLDEQKAARLVLTKAGELESLDWIEAAMSGYNDELVAEHTRLAARALLDEAASGIAEVGSDSVLRVRDPRVIQWLKKRADNFVGGINETTFADLKASLAQGVYEAETFAELRARVNEVFDRVADVERAMSGRGMMIARTEINASSNRGMMEGWRATGEVDMKEWLDSRDEFVRDTHQDVPPVPIDDDFELSDGDSGPCPGEMSDAANVCNCRCTMIPILADASAEGE